MKLIPFPEFPAPERHAVLAVLQRLGLPPGQVCISRVEPVEDPALPSVVLVSAPGWWQAYEGADWVERMEEELGVGFASLGAALRV